MSERAPERPLRDTFRIFETTVSAVTDLSPHFRRLTLTAPEFQDYVPLGWDEYVGLILPPRPEAPLVMPDQECGSNIRQAVAAIDESERPDLRWYTIRDHRPELSEVDIDFVVHGDEGPGTRFARRAVPGDRLGFRECAALYNPEPDGTSRLIVGDESALPAIARILENTSREVDPLVFVEVADKRDQLPLPYGVTWVLRKGEPGEALERAIREAALPTPLDYVWLCAERTGVQNIRRYLTRELNVQKSRITFSGYWKLGEARG